MLPGSLRLRESVSVWSGVGSEEEAEGEEVKKAQRFYNLSSNFFISFIYLLIDWSKLDV